MSQYLAYYYLSDPLSLGPIKYIAGLPGTGKPEKMIEHFLIKEF